MAHKTDKEKPAPTRNKAAERQERAAQALRDNLRRRKAQKPQEAENKPD